MIQSDDSRQPPSDRDRVGDQRRHDDGDRAAEPTASDIDRARARELRRTVLRKSMRRERSQRRGRRNTWSFLGTFGLVGWTVAVPTLLGLVVGLWLDDITDSQTSFTITFLLLGVLVGAAMAWYWIDQERRPDDD